MANEFDCSSCIHAEVCPGYMVTQTECGHYLLREDAAEVVRCEDCEWYRNAKGCPLARSELTKDGTPLPLPDDFCAYGERRR